MTENNAAVRLFTTCAQHAVLRPIANVLRFLQPLAVARKQTSALEVQLVKDPGIPCQDPTTSYWQTPPHPVLSELRSPQFPSETDVVIIGSGITSASIAHHLLSADPTIRVVVVEARAVTSGATGRNGGHILELPYEDYDLQVALLGRERAKKVVAFRLSHLKELLHFSNTVLSVEAAADCEIRAVEVVDAALDESVWQKVQSEVEHFLKDFPECKDEWKLWEKAEARERFGIPAVHGAVSGPAGAIWPYKFVTSVFDRLRTLHGDRFSIETHTAVTDIQLPSEGGHEAPYICHTERGLLRSRHVIHATNGHAAHLLPRMRGKITPLRGQMTVQEYRSPTSCANLGNERSWFLRYRQSFDYMTQSPKTGFFFLGGGVLQGDAHGVSDVGNPSDGEQNFLSRCHLTGVLPRLFTAGEADEGHSILKSSWTGVMGYSCDGRPWVGRLPEKISGRSVKARGGSHECGEWIAAGFCGAGMVSCWRSGQALAAMVGGETPGWFPEALLPTEKRFRSCDASDFAGFFFEMMA